MWNFEDWMRGSSSECGWTEPNGLEQKSQKTFERESERESEIECGKRKPTFHFGQQMETFYFQTVLCGMTCMPLVLMVSCFGDVVHTLRIKQTPIMTANLWRKKDWTEGERGSMGVRSMIQTNFKWCNLTFIWKQETSFEKWRQREKMVLSLRMYSTV